MAEAKTLSYSEGVKGWPSFYSYLADYMIGMNGFFYSWSGGNLYRHNTNATRNNYYGVQYNSEITGVFNVEPQTIKLFKTMSYESDEAWECTALFTDLSDGSMLETYFQEKEGEWYTFLRANDGDVDFNMRSANGLGSADTVTGPPAAIEITFNFNIGSIVSIGDMVYHNATPVLAGPITATTPTSITVDCSSGSIPSPGDFIVYIKDAVAESHGARGYFMEFTLQNDNTEAVELYAVGSNIMKSYP